MRIGCGQGRLDGPRKNDGEKRLAGKLPLEGALTKSVLDSGCRQPLGQGQAWSTPPWQLAPMGPAASPVLSTFRFDVTMCAQE